MNAPVSLSQFIFNLIRPYKKLLLLMGIIAIVWAFITTFTPYTLKLIIDHVVNFTGNKMDLFSSIRFLVLGYIGLWVILFIHMRTLDWIKMRLFPQLREDCMHHMFKYLNQHSHRYFQDNFAGGLINKIVDMQGGIINILTILDDSYAQMLGLSVAVIVLLSVHPVFAIILLGWTILFFIITFAFLRPIQQRSLLFAESRTSLVGKMVDSISNITSIRLFAREKEESQYIDLGIQDAVSKDRSMQAKIITMRIFWDISILLLLGLNLVILLYMYSKGLVTVGDFAFVISLSISTLWNLWFLAGQFVSFSETVGVCKQALSIITAVHEISDKKNARPLIVSTGKIEFHDVTFHYDEGKKLFQNKNVLIEGGQKVGLVGFSGSGKSTFVNLILRLFEVESGKITIDGQDINEVTQSSLREQITFVPQDISLFHRTLLENIQFGSPDTSMEQIIAASKQAHCHEFIKELSKGYQSLVGERGIKLSGGQRQRIAIARAFLKNAPVLILDEATASLDSVTEEYIQAAFSILMQSKTTIVIAHRLSTLAKMDRILVFDNGKIIEDGTHGVLIKNNGHYAKMWEMQAGGFLPVSKLKN